jgi:hypothetical protein
MAGLLTSKGDTMQRKSVRFGNPQAFLRGLNPKGGHVEQRAFTIPELMAVYRIGRTKIYEEIARGRIKTYKIGRATPS